MSCVATDFLSRDSFSDLTQINQVTQRALRFEFKYERMTKVQSAAIGPACNGQDILAKAKTGTGKTLAFLIPTIERLMLAVSDGNDRTALVVSPTRELAMQIHDECVILLKYNNVLRTAVVYGGTNIKTDQRTLSRGVDILVATPGRFIDHIENTPKFLDTFAMKVGVFVLDEADRMLEMGFRPAIDKILSVMPTPSQGRQTLLFSATVPTDLVKAVGQILQSQFLFLDTIEGTSQLTTTARQSGGLGKFGVGSAATLEADDPIATASQVEQDYVITDINDQLAGVYSLLEAEKTRNPSDYKILVFFTTARLTQFYAELFNALGLKTLEIHSRKSQSARQKASDQFKSNTRVIMFSSDVTARGMDYPDVTYVLQVGIPSDTEQYVHRLGRTARAGKVGRGTLLLADFEGFFLNKLQQLPLRNATSSVPVCTSELQRYLQGGLERVPYDTKAQCYSAWLGFYNSSKVRWTKPELVQAANSYALDCLGLQEVPALQRKTIGKMGLKGVPGLVIEEDGPKRQRGGINRGDAYDTFHGGGGGEFDGPSARFSSENDDPNNRRNRDSTRWVHYNDAPRSNDREAGGARGGTRGGSRGDSRGDYNDEREGGRARGGSRGSSRGGYNDDRDGGGTRGGTRGGSRGGGFDDRGGGFGFRRGNDREEGGNRGGSRGGSRGGYNDNRDGGGARGGSRGGSRGGGFNDDRRDNDREGGFRQGASGRGGRGNSFYQ